jgi:hypothetical protein
MFPAGIVCSQAMQTTGESPFVLRDSGIDWVRSWTAVNGKRFCVGDSPGPTKASFSLTDVFKSTASGAQGQARDEVIPYPRHPRNPWFKLKVLF